MPTASILAVVDDLFFVGKIDGTARAVGVPLRTVRNFEELSVAAAEAVPPLILIDLHLAGTDAVELIRKIKADERLQVVPLTAFASHVQTGLIRSAESAGCENVIARSALARDLAEILRRASTGRTEGGA